MAIASALGFGAAGAGVALYAATQGKQDVPPLIFRGGGDTLAAAVADSRGRGGTSVSFAHVEHILLEEDAGARLMPLLSYAFQNGEQSIESNLWILRGASCGAVFGGGDKEDIIRRLTALKNSGAAGVSLPGSSLHEIAARLFDDGAALIPALTPRDGALVCDAYAVADAGGILGYLEGPAARAAALLSGKSVSWTAAVGGFRGESGSAELRCDAVVPRAVWTGDALTGLKLTAAVEGRLLEVWSSGQIPDLAGQAARGAEEDLRRAVGEMQRLGVDALGLRRRAGLGDPLRWDALESQWRARFPALSVTVRITARMSELN
jgi:hypothetical protein